ncbi:MAG: aminotransferase class V-fold PLP-dependent enzyme [Acidimicrobiia bacterium]
MDLIETIRRSVIGTRELVDGPFGPRPVVYADYTASGRAVDFIEDYLRDTVLPLYANTHTESSGTGLQTTRFREEAREIIRRSVGAGDDHAVVFCGSGSTAAIAKLVGVLGISLPAALDERHHLSDAIGADERPVVFIGPYEHHSNELPWRESIADVVVIDEDADGHVDLDHLRRELVAHADRPLLIGSFSAASNVTGILTDTVAVASLLHAHGALSFWDYAAAAPYVSIDMGDPADGPGYLDAIFVSPHKFVGGPGTPGVLVARRELFTNPVPVVPGGGTVSYVNATDHEYLADPEHREEGGTPEIVGSIRAGLVFGLKEAVGADRIMAIEERMARRAIDAWCAHPGIEVLGNREADRLSIVSFVVRRPDGRHLHHNYVVALLSDLFGIQSRGGCSCAGPYGHRLLGIDLDTSAAYHREIGRGCEGIKPGWVRVNFTYFIDDETVDYLIEAVRAVADDGHRLLPSYRFEPATGLWTHRGGLATPPMSLHDVDYGTGEMRYPARPHRVDDRGLAHWLAEGRRVLAAGAADPGEAPSVTADFESLRWFPLPDEAGV